MKGKGKATKKAGTPKMVGRAGQLVKGTGIPKQRTLKGTK